jgi:cytochrome P450
LLGNSMRYLTETPDMQRKLRDDPSLIGSFLEETLRLEGSTKTTFRLARRTVTVGGYEIKAGTKLVIGLAAGNRDPRRWDNAEEFQFNRPKVNQHLAFGRGLHTCIGAPLARAEVRVIMEKFFEHTSEITLSPRHGKPGATDLQYEPSYIIRGLEQLHINFKPR